MSEVIELVNLICAQIAQEEAELRAAEFADALEEEQLELEMLRQHEMMQAAAELEDFSPYDYC